MKKLDLNKTLRTILLVLAIVLMLIKLINKASAEGVTIPDNARQDVMDFYDAHFSASYKSYFESCLEQCPFFVHFHYYTRYNERYFIILYSHQDIGYNFISNTGSVNGAGNPVFRDYNGVREYSTAFTRNQNFVLGDSGRIVMFYSMRTNMTPYISNVSISDFRSDWLVRPSSSYALVTSQSSVAGDNFNIDNSTFNDIVSFGNVYLQTALDSFVYHETDYPLYKDTGFFNIWTSISQSDNKMLNITWDSSVFPSSGSMNYTKSVMDLTIEVNGTAQVVSFDSDENPELFPTSSGSYIPYKFFQKVADLAEVSPSDSFYLTMVSLTQYAYPSGGSSSSVTAYNETSLCSVDLGDLQPEVPAISHVTDISITETNISNTTYFQDVVGGVISSDTSYPIPSWANVCRVGLSDSAFPLWDSDFIYNDIAYNRWVVSFDLRLWYSYQSSDDPSLNASNIVSFTGDIRPLYQWIANDVGQFFDMYYFDNVREFCDVFILDLYINNTSTTPATWDLSQRLIFYTDRYFQRLQIESLGNIQSMIEANTYYTKAIYDYATVRFDGMAQSLEKLRISNNSLLGSINANIINLQGLVSSGTDRIVNAIQGISGGGLSVSDLSGTLNTLFMPSFEWDTVNYQDYLDSLGVLALPFEFVFDTQSIIKNNYSASIVLPVNDFSVPLGKDFNHNNIEFTVFEDQEDFVYNPTNIFPAAIWSVFQYLCAFGLVVGEAWFTYVHIFRKEEKSGDF